MRACALNACVARTHSLVIRATRLVKVLADCGLVCCSRQATVNGAEVGWVDRASTAVVGDASLRRKRRRTSLPCAPHSSRVSRSRPQQNRCSNDIIDWAASSSRCFDNPYSRASLPEGRLLYGMSTPSHFRNIFWPFFLRGGRTCACPLRVEEVAITRHRLRYLNKFLPHLCTRPRVSCAPPLLSPSTSGRRLRRKARTGLQQPQQQPQQR